jgi:hypothetical protein
VENFLTVDDFDKGAFEKHSNEQLNRTRHINSWMKAWMLNHEADQFCNIDLEEFSDPQYVTMWKKKMIWE